jgi:hypothetical protein
VGPDGLADVVPTDQGSVPSHRIAMYASRPIRAIQDQATNSPAANAATLRMQLRAQGAQHAQEIRAKADREATVLLANAQSKGEQTRGEGDGCPPQGRISNVGHVDRRPDWLEGVDTINREMTSERINMRHNCVFHGMTLVNTAVYRDFSENHARYSEKVEIPEINLTLLAHYEMEALGEASTRLNFNVNWMGAKLQQRTSKV